VLYSEINQSANKKTIPWTGAKQFNGVVVWLTDLCGKEIKMS
jgi:hypothetical protein